MNKVLAYTILILLGGKSFAQSNLVPNSSFEDTVQCPISLSQLESAINWINPTTASPDLYHSCCSAFCGNPLNAFGFQSARTGESYAGFHTSDFSGTNVREYIQTQLISPMEAGKSYEVKFYVSLADSSQFACNSIGAYFSPNPISLTNNLNFPQTPQILNNTQLTDKVSWTMVSDTFVAVGGEVYLTIGIFADDFNADTIFVGGATWKSNAHYYIDDISVIKVLDNSVAEYKKEKILLLPNPTKGSFVVKTERLMKSYQIYDAFGRLIQIINNINDKQISVNISSFTLGVYYIIISTNRNILTKRIILTL